MHTVCSLNVLSVLHAVLVLFQATTLNVAFNSHNKALLTIMMSNNVSILNTCMYTSRFGPVARSSILLKVYRGKLESVLPQGVVLRTKVTVV